MINTITFNQDDSCVSVSRDTNHKIYNCEPFGEIYAADEPTAFLKILFSTALTIIVPQTKENRLLKIYNLKQKLKICELIFPSAIVDIKINKKRFVVVLKIGQIYIYDLSCVRLIKILDTKKADTFVGDLSNDDTSLLVVPLSSIDEQGELYKALDFDKLVKYDTLSSPTGWVLVYDTVHLQPRLVARCHTSALKKIAIAGLVVATASVKGTIIRTFHLQQEPGDQLAIFKIHNLRRGHNLATINCLAFNGDQTILASGSENNTVHFYKIGASGPDDGASVDETADDDDASDDANSSKSSDDLNENLANLLISKPPEEEPPGYFHKFNRKVLGSSYTKKLIRSLPYKEYINNLILEPPQRSFAYIKLQHHSPKVEVGFHDDLVLVASYAGHFYHYRIEAGARECRLVAAHELR